MFDVFNCHSVMFSLLQHWINKTVFFVFFLQLNFSGSLISNFCYYGILTILLQQFQMLVSDSKSILDKTAALDNGCVQLHLGICSESMSHMRWKLSGKASFIFLIVYLRKIKLVHISSNMRCSTSHQFNVIVIFFTKVLKSVGRYGT